MSGIELAIPGSAVKCFTTEPIPLAANPPRPSLTLFDEATIFAVQEVLGPIPGSDTDFCLFFCCWDFILSKKHYLHEILQFRLQCLFNSYTIFLIMTNYKDIKIQSFQFNSIQFFVSLNVEDIEQAIYNAKACCIISQKYNK